MKKIIAYFTSVFLIICGVSTMMYIDAEASSYVTTYVTVDESQAIKPSGAEFLGFNDYTSSWSYNNMIKGSYVSDPSYYNLIKDYGFNLGFIRVGFGSIDWKDFVGDIDNRGYNSYALKNYFGLAEYLKSILSITSDAKFCIIVNVDESASDNADLVRFLTLEPDDPNATDKNGFNWAKLRMDFGISKPVNVVVFELSNEYDTKVDSEGEGIIPEVYIQLCNEQIAFMKEVNPNIKFAALSYTYNNSSTEELVNWNSKVISELGPKVDYIVLHHYYHNTNNLYNELERWRLDSKLFTYIDELDTENKPKIYISEHAIWKETEIAQLDERFEVTGMQAAVTTGEYINRLMNHKRVALANYHSLFGSLSTEDSFGSHCWGIFRPYQDGTALMSAVGEYFKMAYDAMGESIVKTTLSGNDYCVDTTSAYASSSERPLSISAHQTSDGGLNLIIVNRSTDVTHNLVFDANGDYYLKKEVVLTSADLNDDNIPSNQDKVSAQTRLINSSDIFTDYTAAPFSVTVLYLEPNQSDFDNSQVMELCIDEPDYNGNISVNINLLSDKAMKDADTICFMVLKGGTDINSIMPDDIVYITEKNAVRGRVSFDITMPQNSNGTYIAYAANKSYGEDCFAYKKFEFTNKQASPVYKITPNYVPNENYEVSLNVWFNDIESSDFEIEVKSDKTGESVHFGTDLITQNGQEYTFYMPKEAPSGKYIIYSGETYASFNFTKPTEKVQIISSPKNASESLFEYSDLAGGILKIGLKNIAEDSLDLKLLAVVYDKNGKILNVFTGETKAYAPNETAEYVINLDAGEVPENIGAVKIFVWENKTTTPLTDFYIIKK